MISLFFVLKSDTIIIGDNMIDKKKSMKNIILISIISVAVISIIFYLNTYYKATAVVKDSLKTNEKVKVEQNSNGILFDGPGEENILVFYPGAKVEYTSYAPLMHTLAENGLDTYIVEMPFNIAFFDMNAIKKVKNKYEYNNWFIGGHSLGGVVAAMNTKKYNIKGLILLASYPTKDPNCKTLSIYGSKDGVLNIEKYQESTKNLKQFTEIIIEGGNHAYFGNYGDQKGDNIATISRTTQQEITINEILKFTEISK